MAAQAGRLVLVKVDATGGGSFQTVTGMRSKSISFNNELVDITDSDSASQHRELLANAGVKSFTITGSGVFKDGAYEEDVRGYALAGTLAEYQFTVPDFGTFEGPFQVSNLEYAGEYNGETTFSMTFESAGEITWTAA